MKLFIYISLVFLVFSCEEVVEFDPNLGEPVVEAFLYAGEPVDDIVLKRVLPFGSDQDTVQFIEDANLVIIHNGIEYLLEQVSDNPGHYIYTGEGLAIIEGETYALSFEFGGLTIYAETTVPNTPEDVSISDSAIRIPQIETLQDLRDLRDNFENTIDIEWENTSGDYYYITVSNIEESPEDIDPNSILPFNFSFISEPTQLDIFPLRLFAHYQQFGLHEAKIYHVNEEYALLYESLEQDSRDLNEPFSNVINGVGVFTAFSSQTVRFEVLKRY